jgi:hypothetical protein
MNIKANGLSTTAKKIFGEQMAQTSQVHIYTLLKAKIGRHYKSEAAYKF